MSKSAALRGLAKNQCAMQALAWMPLVDGTGLTTDDWLFGQFSPAQLESRVVALQAYAVGAYPWTGAADGWPGARFYCALWQYSRPNRERFLAEAISYARRSAPIPYVLGGGSPEWFAPGLIASGMDCSAFVALLLQRAKSGGPDWVNSEGAWQWIHTGSIYSDARGPQKLFREITAPRPGAIFVYPDRGGDEGHTGVILRSGCESTDMYGTDCSSSQYDVWGDAVRLRSVQWLDAHPETIFVEPVWW